MKKYYKIVYLLWVLSTITATSVYASPAAQLKYAAGNNDSELLPPSEKLSMDLVTKTPRGVFFSAAELKILNEDGEIGVLGTAFMSTEVDEIYMTIYLDRWEDDNHWEQVDSFEFEFYAEDYPDGLTSELVAFTLTGYPKRHYYRLRGSYAAVKDGVIEGFSPATDGIMIE